MSQKPLRYIDPLNDLAFKKIFGIEQNKDLLMAFLNEIFKGRKHIVDLVYNKNEYPGELKDIGGTVFDITCTGDQGEQFIIEIQRGEQKHFKDRAIFYTSRVISEQAPKGNRNDWKYKLKEVYLVAIMDDFTFEDTPSSKYLHNIGLCDIDTGELFYNKLSYSFIELCNFDKTTSELETDLDNWLYVLKNLSQMEKLPVYLTNPIFEKLFDLAEYNNLTKDEKASYDRCLKYKWDNENVRAYAIEKAEKKEKEGQQKARLQGLQEGRQEGLQEGRQEGLQEGRQKGRQEGLQEGRQKALQEGQQEGTQEVARKMKDKGLSYSLINECTKLSAQEIESL